MASLCQHIGALNRHCASGGGAFSQLKLDEDTVSIQVQAERRGLQARHRFSNSHVL